MSSSGSVHDGAKISQNVTHPFVQRACGPAAAAIGAAANCNSLTSNPAGELVLFNVNCDTFLTSADQQTVEDFADSMFGSDSVNVHGFASTDGPADFNLKLSCARARAAADVLESRGISPSQISLFQHGEVAGPAREKRSVILERDPQVSRPVPSLSVDRIDVVDSAAGAIGGYPAILGNADLNSPGPFSDPTEVKNVHQIHFHLDRGDSADLTPTRNVDRTATQNSSSGTQTGTRTGNDGPPAHEIQRPSTDLIVIADAPGFRGLAASQYPVTYDADFDLTVSDTGGNDIADIEYEVHIDKSDPTTVNRNDITATAKRDLVRNRNLP